MIETIRVVKYIIPIGFMADLNGGRLWRPYDLKTRKFVGYADTRLGAEKQITRMTAGKRDTRSNWLRLRTQVVPVNLMRTSEIILPFPLPASILRIFGADCLTPRTR